MTSYELPPENVLEDLAKEHVALIMDEVTELRARLTEICADIVHNGANAEKIELTRLLEAALLRARRALDAARRERRFHGAFPAFNDLDP
jgi:hypothetical protein